MRENPNGPSRAYRIPADALVKLGSGGVPRDSVDWSELHPRFLPAVTFTFWL